MVSDRVVAGMNVNVWDVTDDIQCLIRYRVAVDDRRLADPEALIGSLCPSAAHEAAQRRRADQIAIRVADRRGLALRAQMAHVSAVAKTIQTA